MKHSHSILLLSFLALPIVLNADDDATSNLRPIAYAVATCGVKVSF
jgi:hypothetical protein